MTQTLMGSLVVVIESPQPSHLAHLAQRLEQIGVQELVSERAIEALSKSVLLWLSLLDVDEPDTVLFAPVSEGAAGSSLQDDATGAVTLIQRFGSALNLNIHFHILFLDGVYVHRDNRPPRFRRVKAPDKT